MTAGFYLRHFAGFFIQIGAGMFLCIIPFNGDVFRVSRKWIFTICGLIAVLSSAIFPLVIGMEKLGFTSYQSMYANLYMLLAIVAFGIFYFSVLHVEWIKKIIALILVIFYAAMQYLVVNLILSLYPEYTLPEVYAPLTLALFAGTAAVMLPLSTIFMHRVVREYLAEMEMENIRRECGVILLSTIIYLAMLVTYASWPDSLLDAFGEWVIPPLLMGALLISLLYWDLFRESLRRKRDAERNKTLEIQKLQYETIMHEVEQTRQMRHDMHHSLNRLSDLMAQGDEEAMKEYLSELTVWISHRDMVNYCKNPVLNGLLQYYVGMANDKDIECKVHVECGDISISAVDLTVMLGNAMENAIRACGTLETDRWISIEIGVLSGSMLIQVMNPCDGVQPSGKYRMNGGFLPAAAFMSRRVAGGYGLYSIENTARRYDGEAGFRYDNQEGTFTVRVRLSLNPAKE